MLEFHSVTHDFYKVGAGFSPAQHKICAANGGFGNKKLAPVRKKFLQELCGSKNLVVMRPRFKNRAVLFHVHYEQGIACE